MLSQFLLICPKHTAPQIPTASLPGASLPVLTLVPAVCGTEQNSFPDILLPHYHFRTCPRTFSLAWLNLTSAFCLLPGTKDSRSSGSFFEPSISLVLKHLIKHMFFLPSLTPLLWVRQQAQGRIWHWQILMLIPKRCPNQMLQRQTIWELQHSASLIGIFKWLWLMVQLLQVQDQWKCILIFWTPSFFLGSFSCAMRPISVMPEGIWGRSNGLAIHTLASLPVSGTAEGEVRVLETRILIMRLNAKPGLSE